MVLNKCPSQWVNGIYDALGIPVKRLKKSFANMLSNITRLEGIIYGLRKESLKTLPFVYKDRSWVKYGQLRLHGLLAIGKNPVKGRMYKVVIIPKD